MVAAVCTWHEHHTAAFAEIENRLERGERLAVAAPALTETYAVLTRLPAPHRLAPADAWSLIEASFVRNARVVALKASDYVKLLALLSRNPVGGSRTYDALIAECALQANAAELLTFNRRHFGPPLDKVQVVEPSRTSRT